MDVCSTVEMLHAFDRHELTCFVNDVLDHMGLDRVSDLDDRTVRTPEFMNGIREVMCRTPRSRLEIVRRVNRDPRYRSYIMSDFDSVPGVPGVDGDVGRPLPPHAISETL